MEQTTKIKSKLPHVGTTIFTVMSKMAQEYQAINLAQGFPNFPVDPRLTEIIHRNLDGQFHQYAPMPGHPELIEQLVILTETQYQRSTTASEILVTAGATQAIFTIIQAIVHPGDEVVLIDPAYDCYDPPIRLAGAIPVHVAMEADFTIDWVKLEETITPKTRLLIVNNPHNPSGTIWTAADLEAVKGIMERHPQMYLLSDEVYEYISFEGRHQSAHSLKDFSDRVMVVSSFGKTFHITGWKVGYIVADEAVMTELKKVHQFLVFSVNHLAQKSLADYLKIVNVSDLADFYRSKRDYFQGALKNSRFRILPAEGTYFQTVDYSAISDERDVEFSQRLVREYGVAAIPMSVFYEQDPGLRVLRFCFAKDQETLDRASAKLCQI